MRVLLPILAVFALLAVSFTAMGGDRVGAGCEPAPCEAPVCVDLDGDLDEGLGVAVADLWAYRPRPLEPNTRVVSLGGQPEARAIFRPPQRSGA